MPKPLVSVILPVFNAEKYLSIAIDSILAQTMGNFELIAVNDGSRDGSLKILRKYEKNDKRIRVIDQQNKGLVKTLNRVLKYTRADIVMRMDADDLSAPERIQLQYEYLEDHPEVLVVGCRVKMIDEDGNDLPGDPRPTEDASLKLFLGYGCAVGSPTMMLRKEIFNDKTLLFSEDKWPAEDYGWLCDLVTKNPNKQISLLPDYLYEYRQNLNGISRSNEKKQAERTKAIGDAYRNELIKKGWAYCTFGLHREWMRSAAQLQTQEEMSRLVDIYYTTQLWFYNDEVKIRPLHAHWQRAKLRLYTLLLSPEHKRFLVGRPKAHFIPEI